MSHLQRLDKSYLLVTLMYGFIDFPPEMLSVIVFYERESDLLGGLMDGFLFCRSKKRSCHFFNIRLILFSFSDSTGKFGMNPVQSGAVITNFTQCWTTGLTQVCI